MTRNKGHSGVNRFAVGLIGAISLLSLAEDCVAATGSNAGSDACGGQRQVRILPTTCGSFPPVAQNTAQPLLNTLPPATFDTQPSNAIAVPPLNNGGETSPLNTLPPPSFKIEPAEPVIVTPSDQPPITAPFLNTPLEQPNSVQIIEFGQPLPKTTPQTTVAPETLPNLESDVPIVPLDGSSTVPIPQVDGTSNPDLNGEIEFAPGLAMPNAGEDVILPAATELNLRYPGNVPLEAGSQ